MLTKEQQRKAVKSIIESGELDLGFCKIVKKHWSGGRGGSGKTIFQRKPFIRLNVLMTPETKKELSTGEIASEQ